MQDLQDALHRLPKVNPSERFIKKSKNRLLYQAELHKNETWFKAFFRRLNAVMPSEAFLTQARLRLIERITTVKPSWVWLALVKRLAASTLVMILAVTATLFFVDGRQIVSAEEATYIEILSGSATVKHADRLIWDEITDQIELAAGDLVKVSTRSEAVIHFFDDSQIRLTENSLLLINNMSISPAYERQGVIEVFLHEGGAWVQTLNVDDGYAGLTIITRDAIAKAVNSTFSVQTGLNTPTILSVFQNKIGLTTLQPDTREAIDTLKVNADNQIKITSSFGSAQKPIITINPITLQDRANKWIENNLQRDQEHLVELRENELQRLRQTAGVLPGSMFYPIKQAKERLKLAFSFGESSIENAQIEIANKRLDEAVLLLQKGDRQKAMESLLAYQGIAREIAEYAKDDQEDQLAITHRLITPYQKTLTASLPTTSVSMVKEALNQTEELLVDDPIKREEIRLENSVERLQDAMALVESGDLDSAKETLVNNELIVTTILNEVESIENDEEKKQLLSSILELRNEELSLIKEIAEDKEILEALDPQFVAILESAEEKAQKEVINTIAYIRPLAPDLIREHKEQQATDGRIQYFVDKINIYKTWQGQKNQINRLLKEQGIEANNIVFLTELRGHVDARMGDYINSKILELESKDRYLKHKIVGQKIGRAIRDREN
jgi:hypothetical protein